MLNIELDEAAAIATLFPEGPLSENDFTRAAKAVDPYIDRHGKLNGIIIVTEKFPGWESFAAALNHFRFVKEHHKKVSCVALVTDSELGDLGEKIADHFVSARIRHFAFNELGSAREWINASLK